MQAEHSRGNGFIISPLSVPLSAEKPKKENKPRRIKRSFPTGVIKDFIFALSGEWTYIKKSVTASALSFCAVVGCIIFFCSFFTVGTAIYKGSKLVGVSASDKEYLAALSSAKEYASSENSDIGSISFKTTPTITLRSKLCDSSVLCDKLLISSGAFNYGCTLYSGSDAIFTAESEAAARQILDTYLASYSLYGDAIPDTELSYKTTLLPINKISDNEVCTTLLSESEKVPVVCIANSSTHKEIPFETETQYDNGLYVGESVTVTHGQAGSSEIESETVYRNGELETVRVLSENVVATPVTQVIRVGTKYKDVLKSGLFYAISGTLSSPFGERWGRMHEGIDIIANYGEKVIAADDGIVIRASWFDAYGNCVDIKHKNGTVTRYAHCSSLDVQVGQPVVMGQVIARVGSTGRSTANHVHFEVMPDGYTPTNPYNYVVQ